MRRRCEVRDFLLQMSNPFPSTDAEVTRSATDFASTLQVAGQEICVRAPWYGLRGRTLTSGGSRFIRCWSWIARRSGRRKMHPLGAGAEFAGVAGAQQQDAKDGDFVTIKVEALGAVLVLGERLSRR